MRRTLLSLPLLAIAGSVFANGFPGAPITMTLAPNRGPAIVGFIQLENGSYLLQENGGKINR